MLPGDDRELDLHVLQFQAPLHEAPLVRLPGDLQRDHGDVPVPRQIGSPFYKEDIITKGKKALRAYF